MDQDSIDEMQRMINSELEMIEKRHLKGTTSYKGISKNLNTSFNKIKVQKQPPKQQKLPAQKPTVLRRTRSQQSAHVRPTSKEKVVLPPRNQVAIDYVRYAPTIACEPNQSSLDEFLNQNEFADSLLQNFGHYAEQSQQRPTVHRNHTKTDEPQCSFRPMLLRKSLVIAQKLGDPIERLTKPKDPVAKPQEYSFRPKVNRAPSYLKVQEDSLNSSSRSSQPRWKQLYQRGQMKQLQLKQQRESLQDVDLDQSHTFQPNISMSQNSCYAQSDMSFVDRHNCWAARKQQRIAQKAVEVEHENLQQCSFRPSLTRTSQSPHQPSQISEFGKKGWVEFFERVGMAKRQKQPETKQPGQSWQNKLTRPQEPKLLSRTKSFNSSKENLSSAMNVSTTSIIKQMAPEIQYLRKELLDWNF